MMRRVAVDNFFLYEICFFVATFSCIIFHASDDCDLKCLLAPLLILSIISCAVNKKKEYHHMTLDHMTSDHIKFAEITFHVSPKVQHFSSPPQIINKSTATAVAYSFLSLRTSLPHSTSPRLLLPLRAQPFFSSLLRLASPPLRPIPPLFHFISIRHSLSPSLPLSLSPSLSPSPQIYQ